MDGVLHVIEQLGLAHKAAVEVVEQQARRIAELEGQITQGALPSCPECAKSVGDGIAIPCSHKTKTTTDGDTS